MTITDYTMTTIAPISPPRAPSAIPEVDKFLGVILLVCFVLGVPANCAACYHFITQTARNKNSFFFKRLYTLISVLDVLIGIAQLPIAQTLLLGRESDNLFFRHEHFCYSWYVVWLLVKQGAVFMVAFLSISRLTILICSNRVMKLRNTWLVPAAFACFILTILAILPLSTRYAIVRYIPDNAMCRITVHDPNQITGNKGNDTADKEMEAANYVTSLFTTNEPKYKAYFIRSFIVTITEACFIGLPVLPIFISFAFSLKFLKQADRRSQRITQKGPKRGELLRISFNGMKRGLDGSAGTKDVKSGGKTAEKPRKLERDGRAINKPITKHQEASVTILMVTLTYVIFNIPAFCMTVYLAYVYCRCLRLIYSPHYSDQLLWEYASAVYTTFGKAWPYVWFLMYGLSQVLNSTVNPWLYMWRMRHFRQFVARNTLRFSESTRNLRMAWSRSYSTMSTGFDTGPNFRNSTKYQSVVTEEIS